MTIKKILQVESGLGMAEEEHCTSESLLLCDIILDENDSDRIAKSQLFLKNYMNTNSTLILVITGVREVKTLARLKLLRYHAPM